MRSVECLFQDGQPSFQFPFLFLANWFRYVVDDGTTMVCDFRQQLQLRPSPPAAATAASKQQWSDQAIGGDKSQPPFLQQNQRQWRSSPVASKLQHTFFFFFQIQGLSLSLVCIHRNKQKAFSTFFCSLCIPREKGPNRDFTLSHFRKGKALASHFSVLCPMDEHQPT